MAERADIMPNSIVLIALAILIIQIYLVIIFGIGKQETKYVRILSGTSLVGAAIVPIMTAIKAADITTPAYVGSGIFAMISLIVIVAQVLTIGSTFEK